MPMSNLAAVVMAGGLGTRMHSRTPKHLHPVLGRRLVDWVVATAQEAGADRVVVVTAPDTRDAFPGVEGAVGGRRGGRRRARRRARPPPPRAGRAPPPRARPPPAPRRHPPPPGP